MKTRISYKVLVLFLVITMLFQLVQPLSISAEQELAEQEQAVTLQSVGDDETVPLPRILAEVEEKRTADTKHFRLSDGSFYAVQYQEPVHYQDENGTWQQYDNSVIEENDELKNKKSDKDIRLSNKSKTNNMVKMTVDGYAISWGYEDVNGVKGEVKEINQTYEGNDAYLNLTNIQQEVLYEDAFLDADLQYLIEPSGVKENIILKTPQAQNTYTLQYRIDKLTAYQIDAQTIHLKDDEGNIIYILSAPYMTDAAGECSTAVTLTLTEQKNKKLQVILSADQDWLQAADRTYPVVLDPAVQTEQEWNTDHGTFISSKNPSYEYGVGGNHHEGTFYVGRGNDYGVTRTLIKPGTLPELNKGDMVVSAYISLVQRFNDATMQINAHEITKSWETDSACWNSNITYDPTVLDYVKSTSGDGKFQIDFNITSLVKEWYNSAEDITDVYGVMFISDTENESRNQQMRFFSTASYGINDIYRPWFTVVYRNNKGLESYWTYTQISAGTAGTAYINDYTGNLVFVTNGVSTGGNLMPASLYAIYNGYMAGTVEDNTKPTIGKGFRLNVQQTLLPSTEYGLEDEEATQYPYVYTDADGTEHYFYKKTENNTTTYWDEDGLGLQLIITSSSNTERYKLTDDKDNIVAFYSTGRLNYIQDSNGNRMTVNYSSSDASLITGVTDGAGKTLQTQGYSSTYNLRDAAGRATYFNFDSNGYMVKAYYSTGDTYYTYDSDGALSTVTDNDGYKIEFFYTSLENGKMVEKVKEYGTDGSLGQVITFDRSKYNTTIVRTAGIDGIYGNEDDILTTYQFDNFGRTISVESHTEEQEMGAAAYGYTSAEPNSTASNIKQLNRVSKAHSLGVNTVNLLKNSSAEQSGSWTAATWGADCTFTGSFTTNDKYLGQKSFQLNVTSHEENARARYYQDLDNTILKPGHTYTLSGYVKTSNISNSTDTYGACLVAYVFRGDDTYTTFWSEYVYGTTNNDINNGWKRVSVTFTVPDNASKTRINLAIRNCDGTAWFDAIQVEETDAPNIYNMVENSSFENYSSGIPTNWTTSSLTVNSSNDYTVSADKHHGTYSFRMKGVAASNKYIYQSIPISGTEKDIYILSGWAKANAVPDPGDDTRKFKFSVEVKYSDGTSVWKAPVAFNHDITDWQFASSAFNLSDGTNTEKTPTAIVIYLRYAKQQNTVYYDQIQLIKDTAQTYTYDSDGNLITVVDSAEQKSNMEYTNTDLTKSTDAKGYDYTYTYDDNHNMTKATSQRGVISSYTYNDKGLATVLSVHNADNTAVILSRAQYTNGYLYATIDPDMYTTYYTYDTDKGTLQSVRHSSGLTGVTNYTYNSSTDQLLSVQQNKIDNTTKISRINYTYSRARLTKVQSPTTQYNFTYDVFGNTLQTFIGTRSLIQHTYDQNNGVLLRSDFGNGNYVTYTYDQAGNVTAISYNGTVKYEWKTDSAGRTTSYIDNVNQQQTNYEYDSIGRLIRTNTIDLSKSANTDRSLYATEYEYDENNNVTKVVNVTPSGTYITQTEYMEDNLPDSVELSSGEIVSYDYDSLNRLTGKSIDTTNPIDIGYTYWAAGQSTSGQTNRTTTKIQQETIENITYTYTYDAVGNITSILEQNGTVVTDYTMYLYDELNQLVQERSPQRNLAITYTYDNNGNIQTIKTYPYTTGSLGTPTSTITYSYENEEWGDLLTKYNGQTITYDNIGNPLTWRNGMTMTWQDGRRLSSLQTNGKNIQYTYDADGLRVTKTVDGTKHTYQYVGGQLMYETRGNISFSYEYDAYGNLSCIHYIQANGTSVTYYVVCNSRGDVTAIYAADGTLRAKYTYDSWGNTLSVTDANGNAITSAIHIGNLNLIRYRGYYYDNESGLYYLQSRYYDPQVKRFLNADGYVSTGQGVLATNMFAYCENNPVNLADPTGKIGIAVAVEVIRGAMAAIAIALGTAAIVDEDDARSIATEIEIAISNIFSNRTAWEQEEGILPQPAPAPQPAETAAARVPEIVGSKAIAREDVAIKKRQAIPQYFEATRVSFKSPTRSEVIIGKPLTYAEALLRVAMGLDVMCLHQGAAIAIAKVYPYNVGPENHGRGKLGIYYDHYHPNRHSHVHIWYLGPTIVNE